MENQKIDWQYLCGGSGGSFSFDRYHHATINGVRVERHRHNDGTEYAIGNIDKATEKYKTDAELIKAVEILKHP